MNGARRRARKESTSTAGNEGRWIKTTPGKGGFAYMRIYGPEAAAFDKSWKPGDFEVVK